MNLIKWLRKNNMKVMAVVVVLLMIAFIMPASLKQFGQTRGGQNKIVALMRENTKITNYDMLMARQELDILKMLRVEEMLRGVAVPLFRVRDFHALLLNELLFSEQGVSPALIRHMEQLIRTNEYRISSKQLNDIYKRPMGSDVYWLLLKAEAEQAGVRISNEIAGEQLSRTIPQIFPKATYSQVIGLLINQRGVPEGQILTTFGKLLAVMEYSRMICSGEIITSRQTTQDASWDNETIDTKLVRFDSSVFAESQSEPAQEEISTYFEKYKKFFAGDATEQNPHGLGYKLPDRVMLEYIAVKLDDISKTVTKPTQEEIEEYYQRHREELFKEQIPSDPNDPNSAPTERIKGYAEVAGLISKQLLQNKINTKAENILQEGKTITDAGFEGADIESANLSTEQLRQMAIDYETTARKLTEKHKIDVYAGRTGQLSAIDIQTGEYTKMLYMQAYGGTVVGLCPIVFSIDEIKASDLGPFDVPKPRMYENIGPMKDGQGKIMALVRVIEAHKATEPESVNQTFSKSSFKFEPTSEKTEDVYSVKDKVAEDLKKLSALDTTKSKAEEFIKEVVKDGWDGAIDRFNKLYGQQIKKQQGDPNTFRLQDLTNLRRLPESRMGTLAVESEGTALSQYLAIETKKESQRIDKLYSLVPEDANALDSVPVIMEFKPDMSYYVIENLSVKRLSQEQYQKIKALQIYKEDVVQSQSLAAAHFNPENIIKRMNFRLIKEKKQEGDVNKPAESGGRL